MKLAPPWTEARLRSDASINQLLGGCAVASALVSAALRGDALGRDELLVLRHTLGHLPSGPGAFNFLLSRVPGATPRDRLKAPLRDQPTSCRKVTKRVPDLAWEVGCGCEFECSGADYPNPLLHVTAPEREGQVVALGGRRGRGAG